MLKERVLSVKRKLLGGKIKRYAIYFMNHEDSERKRIADNKRIMIIHKGDYDYPFFNVCYLNNMMALIVYSLYCGCIPVIAINEDETTKMRWNWYFNDPISYFGVENISDFSTVECEINNSAFQPNFSDVWDFSSENFRIWRFFYKRFAMPNDNVLRYITQELSDLRFSEKQTIGCLLRGTDYIKLKPKGHPIQPDPQIIINCLADKIYQSNYKCIYVASEEKALVDIIKQSFPALSILENKRTYYDKQYYSNNYTYVTSVTGKDNYTRGLEYLSSISILSHCSAIVAASSGGSLAACYYSDNTENYEILNFGKY